MTKKRTVKSVNREIIESIKTHKKFYGTRRFNNFFPLLMGQRELESYLHIEWLRGYLQSMKDERGIK